MYRYIKRKSTDHMDKKKDNSTVTNTKNLCFWNVRSTYLNLFNPIEVHGPIKTSDSQIVKKMKQPSSHSGQSDSTCLLVILLLKCFIVYDSFLKWYI